MLLGEPGSGKTVLLVRLVLDLLARRHSGEPVPVLVPLASWDPDREDLDTWLEQRLGIDYPWLSEAGRSGTSKGRELLDLGAIQLVLDGLDEIPDGVRGRAVTRINDTLGLHPDVGIVLSSRTAPFAATIRPASGHEVRVTGAAAVEVQPLDLDTVASYLSDSAGGPNTRGRWGEVFAALNTMSPPKEQRPPAGAHLPEESHTPDEPHPLAALLTTPLMAYLARVAYDNPLHAQRQNTPPPHPRELLDLPTAAAIRTHLLDAFIPASYAPDPPEPPTSSRPPKEQWTRGQAARYLTFLAHDLEHRQHGTTDLRWWDLAGAAPRVLAGAIVGLLAVPAGIVMPFGAWLGVGMVVGVIVAVIGRRWSPPTQTFTRGLAGGLTGSVLGAAFGLGMRLVLGVDSPAGYFVSGLALGLVPGFLGGFRAGLAGGAVAALVGAFAGNPQMGDPAPWVNSVGFAVAAAFVVTLGRGSLPALGLRWSPLGILTGAGGGIALGVAVTLQAGLQSGLLAGAVGALGGSFGAGLEARPAETVAADPQASLHKDRLTFWLTAVAGGLAIGLAAAMVIAAAVDPWRGAMAGLADGLATGVAWAFLQARYGSFTLARSWLALRRQVPWHLMPFLADAHRRGVLRQAGATYQLRHAELQRRLAEEEPPDPNPHERTTTAA
nr:NACHT domain-containing protein [Streptomyces sp. NBC_00899]